MAVSPSGERAGDVGLDRRRGRNETPRTEVRGFGRSRCEGPAAALSVTALRGCQKLLCSPFDRLRVSDFRFRSW